jgi:DNA-binding transcriptional ArsR family regulator
VEIRLASVLDAGARTIGDLATAINCRPEVLSRLLAVLGDLGLVAIKRYDQDVFYELGPLGGLLVENGPHSAVAFVHAYTGMRYSMYEHLSASLRDGAPMWDKVCDVPFFEWLASEPAERRAFDDAMQERSALQIPQLLPLIDLSESSRVIDIGGGNGYLANAISERYPGLWVAIFDRGFDNNQIEYMRPPERIFGDFFASVPTGYDTYLVKHILHDWGDDECVSLLRNIRDAMDENSKLLIIESLLDDAAKSSALRLLDLHMFGLTGGAERSRVQVGMLLARADLRMISVQGDRWLSVVTASR